MAHSMNSSVAPDTGDTLTPEELESIRAPIGQALTLPARAYTSEAFMEVEVDRIFFRHWVAVGFAATLPDPGDMRPVELFGRPLLLVRGDDGSLRAFHNICPYDGCLAVLAEQRRAPDIEVYYHGWRYDLRGRLSAAPYWDGTPAGHLDSLGGRNCDLVEIRSECRFGVLFVDLGPAEGRGGRVISALGKPYSALNAPCIIVDGESD